MTQLLAIDIKNTYFGANHQNAATLTESPASLVNTLIQNSIIVAGIIFLFFILFAGVKIVFGAGKNQSSQDASKAKAALTWSIVGFLIVAFSYFILRIVGAFIGFNDITSSHF